MTSDPLENSQLVPDAAAFLDDLLPVEILPPLEEPAALPSEPPVPAASTLLADMQAMDMSPPVEEPPASPSEPDPEVLAYLAEMLAVEMPPPMEEAFASPSEPLAPDATAFLDGMQPAEQPLPQEEPAASPSEPLVPDATAFLGDLLSMNKASTPDGLLAPSEALSIKREIDESVAKLGERAGSVVGQGVQVSNLRLFIRFDQASEVSEMTRIFRLPGTPKWVCGLANLHGNLVPVLDIASFLSLPNEAGEKPILLVLGHGENAVAIPVSGIPERLRFGEVDRIPAPLVGEHLQPYVPGAFTRGNDIWLELEHEKLLRTLAASLAS